MKNLLAKMESDKGATRINIASMLDVQKYMEQYAMPFGSNISQFMTLLLEAKHAEDFHTVEIAFDKKILPDAYQTNPQMWANAYTSRTLYEVLQAYKEDTLIILRASSERIRPWFMHRIQDALKNNTQVTFKIEDIPPSYRLQPFTIVSKMKARGFPIRILHLGEKSITYAKRTDNTVRPTRKLHPVGSSRAKRKDKGRTVHPAAVQGKRKSR